MTDTIQVMTDPRLWVQITRDLREKLNAGVIAPGDTVSITRLSEEWGTCRETVAKSLHALEDEGLIRRYPGLGYYVLSRS
jgi:DNA-binding GntR family transcriptional regulator